MLGKLSGIVTIAIIVIVIVEAVSVQPAMSKIAPTMIVVKQGG